VATWWRPASTAVPSERQPASQQPQRRDDGALARAAGGRGGWAQRPADPWESRSDHLI
jgi:hypothetical protein